VSRARLLAVAGGTLLALVLLVYGTTGLVRVRAMQHEMRAMEREVAALRSRTRELTEIVEKLRHDPATIEKLAREELGYVREGETVLKFPPSAAPR
jgi:cell division protein FtsB